MFGGNSAGGDRETNKKVLDAHSIFSEESNVSSLSAQSAPVAKTTSTVSVSEHKLDLISTNSASASANINTPNFTNDDNQSKE